MCLAYQIMSEMIILSWLARIYNNNCFIFAMTNALFQGNWNNTVSHCKTKWKFPTEHKYNLLILCYFCPHPFYCVCQLTDKIPVGFLYSNIFLFKCNRLNIEGFFPTDFTLQGRLKLFVLWTHDLLAISYRSETWARSHVAASPSWESQNPLRAFHRLPYAIWISHCQPTRR